MSLIFLTWCISTSVSLPHITQGAAKFDLVNLAFQTTSIFFNGSWFTPTALAMFVALAYAVSMKEILLSLFTS